LILSRIVWPVLEVNLQVSGNLKTSGNLEYKRNGLRTVLSALQNQISAAKDSLKFFQSILDQKIQTMAETDKKLPQLENIKNNNKDYQRIEQVDEQKANDVLNNRKAVVLAAVISVLGEGV
jgi:flagellar biosynthesis chaperone FliJ